MEKKLNHKRWRLDIYKNQKVKKIMIPGRIVTQVCNFFQSKNYISTFYVSIQSKGREEVEKKFLDHAG